MSEQPMKVMVNISVSFGEGMTVSQNEQSVFLHDTLTTRHVEIQRAYLPTLIAILQNIDQLTNTEVDLADSMDAEILVNGIEVQSED